MYVCRRAAISPLGWGWLLGQGVSSQMMGTTRRGACGLCGDSRLLGLPLPRANVGGALAALPGLGLVRCAGCGAEQVEPRPDDAALAAFYQGADYTAHEPVDDVAARQRAAYQLAFLERFGAAVRGARILDVGSGGGQLLVAARQAGAVVCAVDPAAHAHKASERLQLEHVARIEELGERRFDGIVMSHVLEHVPDPVAVLAALRARLAPGGYLVIEVPNRASLRAQASPRWMTTLGADERHRAFPAHLWYFTPRTLLQAAARAGFELVAQQTVGLGLEALVPAWLGASLRRGREGVSLRRGREGERLGEPSAVPGAQKRGERGGLRSQLKRAYHRALLGESLLVLARPKG